MFSTAHASSRRPRPLAQLQAWPSSGLRLSGSRLSRLGRPQWKGPAAPREIPTWQERELTCSRAGLPHVPPLGPRCLVRRRRHRRGVRVVPRAAAPPLRRRAAATAPLPASVVGPRPAAAATAFAPALAFALALAFAAAPAGRGRGGRGRRAGRPCAGWREPTRHAEGRHCAREGRGGGGRL